MHVQKFLLLNQILNFVRIFDWIPIIGGFLMSVIAALISFYDKNKEFKKDRSNPSSFRLLFFTSLIGAGLTLASAVKSYIEKTVSAAKAEKAQTQIDSTNEVLLKSQQLNNKLLLEQKDSAYKIMSSQNRLLLADEKLAIANDKIQVLQDSVIKDIYGNGNVPLLEVFPRSPDRSLFRIGFMLQNIGTTTLRGIRAHLFDMYSDIEPVSDSSGNPFEYRSKSRKAGKSLHESYMENQKEILLGNLFKHTWREFYTMSIPKTFDEFGYRLEISWDNGKIEYTFSGTGGTRRLFPSMKLDTLYGTGGMISREIVRMGLFNIPDSLIKE
jgi:hypothetical protein